MKETEITEIKNQDLGIKTILKKVISYSFKYNYGFACWKSPESGSLNIIIDTTTDKYNPIHPDLESLSAGFLVSPFENDNNRISYLIPAEIHLEIDLNTEKHKIIKPIEGTAINPTNILNSILEFEIKETRSPYSKHELNIQDQSNEKDNFQDIVANGIQEIQNNIFEKVVPSRVESISLPDNFDLSSRLLDLIAALPHAFVSLFHLKGHGLWIGASPEILIQVEGNKYFTTTAVAGTQELIEGAIPSKAAWTQKEIVEQAMVSRYIINCFKKIRLREFEESGPKTVSAGNLLHLRTDFKVDMKSVNFPQLGSVMLKLLHPTSAICGMPKEKSLAFLRKYEVSDRSFFSGYIGPVNVADKTSLYVNIRCAQIFNKSAMLFAGAGVTIDSEPEREWEETSLKLNTIKSLLVD